MASIADKHKTHNNTQSPLRKVRSQAMELFLTTRDFLFERDLRKFEARGWSREQIEMALDDLARAGKVELVEQLDGCGGVSIMACLVEPHHEL